MSKVFLTKEGFEKLKEELIELKTTKRQEAGAALAEAREKGDLSENAEYDAAKEEQAKLEKRIAMLETSLSNVRLLTEDEIDTDSVSVLTYVKLLNKNNNREMEYQLVSEIEADFKQKKMSVTSPIGRGLLGHKKGETVAIETPGGTIKFEILNIRK